MRRAQRRCVSAVLPPFRKPLLARRYKDTPARKRGRYDWEHNLTVCGSNPAAKAGVVRRVDGTAEAVSDTNPDRHEPAQPRAIVPREIRMITDAIHRISQHRAEL